MKKSLILLALPLLLSLGISGSKVESKTAFQEDTLAHDELFVNAQRVNKAAPVKKGVAPEVGTIGVQYAFDDKGDSDASNDVYHVRYVAPLTDLDVTVAWTRNIYKADGTKEFGEKIVRPDVFFTSVNNGGDVMTATGSVLGFTVYTLYGIPATHATDYLTAYLTVTKNEESTVTKTLATTIDQSTQFAFETTSNNFFLTGTIGGTKKDVSAENPTDGNNAASFVTDFQASDRFYIVQKTDSLFKVWDGTALKSKDNFDDEGALVANVAGKYRIWLNKSNEIYISNKFGEYTNYYLRGTAAAGWDNFDTNDYRFVTEPYNKGVLLNVHLKVGEFKVGNQDWTYSKGYYQLNGGAKDLFSLSGSDDIHCGTEGNYNFYLTNNDLIYVEKAGN